MGALAVAAAAVVFLTGVAHSYLGERFVLVPLFTRRDLPEMLGSDLLTKRTLRFVWHLLTVAWWGFGVIILQLANRANVPTLGATIAVTAFASASLAFIVSRGRHLGWVAFLAAAFLTWYATR
jgi:hypothetical protein